MRHLRAQRERNDRREEEIRALPDVEMPNVPPLPQGSVWNAFTEENCFQLCTNFLLTEVTDLWQRLLPHSEKAGHRGPRPKSSWADCLLTYLAWAASGLDFGKLAKDLNMKEGRCQKNVERVRPVLRRMLEEYWLEPRQRPQPLVDSTFPQIALLLDNTSTQCFRPKAPFAEAKIYWDGKNSIYGLKNEVAVQAHPPHYALFISQHTVGSTHDYTFLKSNYTTYLEYLIKRPDEQHLLPLDTNYGEWAVLMDKGYQGPPEDTPGLRRITPTKGQNLTLQQRVINKELHKLRTPIEQFFGRLQQLWPILRNCYRWDHRHFDDDFTICVLLTNEHIRRLELSELDFSFKHKLALARHLFVEEKQRKRKEQVKRYLEKKKLRIEGQEPVLVTHE